MGTIRLRATRPFWHGQRIIGTSELVRVTPAQAADILAAGRAELVEETEAAEIAAAIQQQTNEALAKERAGLPASRRRGHLLADGRWQVVFPVDAR
jgi:hypothetical protein